MTRPIDRVRSLAYLLDSAFRVPGTKLRFGVDPLLGLVPGLGDLVGGGMGAYLLWLAARAGASPPVLLRMGANLALDSLIGAIPLLGDLLDAGWKANAKNLAILEVHLAHPQKARRSSFVFFGVLLLLIVGAVIGTIWLTLAALGAIAGLFG